jgi:hypothetical protein
MIADDEIPSVTRYVNVCVPTNEPPDLNLKPPSAASDSEPFEPASTSTAWRVSPSASVSFARTPGGETERDTPVVAEYASAAPTGAAFVTLIVTVLATVYIAIMRRSAGGR